MIFTCRANGFRRYLSPHLIGDHGGVGALVRIDSDDDHDCCVSCLDSGLVAWSGRSAYPGQGRRHAPLVEREVRDLKEANEILKAAS